MWHYIKATTCAGRWMQPECLALKRRRVCEYVASRKANGVNLAPYSTYTHTHTHTYSQHVWFNSGFLLTLRLLLSGVW